MKIEEKKQITLNKEIPGFAEGTDGWLQVSQPTMIMVGEGRSH